jgi:uncharacterized repeat protein (TIGR03943 family)
VLAGLGLFLLQKMWSGTLYWYINERFAVLVLAAAVGLLVLARSVLPGSAVETATTEARYASRPSQVSEGHEHEQAVPGWRLWVVALPVILGLLVPARPLGSAALANKGLNSTAPLAAGDSATGAAVARLPEARTVMDWVRAFGAAEDAQIYAGEPADVVGFVYHDPVLPPGQFIVSRFVVSCCAADAMGVGLPVAWPGAEALQGDAWVRVRGPVQVGSYHGRAIAVIAAESVEGVAAPVEPYLAP